MLMISFRFFDSDGQETKLEDDDCPLRKEYPKARTHAIINLKASTNYVLCAPNGMKHLSKVDYATILQFTEVL